MTFKMMIPFVLRMREDCWPKGKRDLVGENMLGRLPVTQAGIQPCVKCSFAVKKCCSQFGYGQISGKKDQITKTKDEFICELTIFMK